jgi:hypothetical protein
VIVLLHATPTCALTIVGATGTYDRNLRVEYDFEFASGTRALLLSSCGALEQCTHAALLLSLTLSTLAVISSRKTA